MLSSGSLVHLLIRDLKIRIHSMEHLVVYML